MFLRLASLVLLASFTAVAQSAPPPSNPDSSTPSDQPQAPPLISCPAGAPTGPVNLRVQSPENGEPLPFQTINHLSEGDIVLYSPILRGKQKRPGEVSLVMVPVKREPKEPALLVTEPKPADKPQQWKIDKSISLAAFVYGPQGLSRKKVEGFLSQDDVLIAQLADYAEKTAQTEALVQALSNAGSSSDSVNAALTGFASQYGLSAQIDRTAPPAAQAQTLFATMNPQLATYNPLASSTGERVAQTASVATAAATLFFGSPIGLLAGGTAMLLDLRYIAFPGTEFRSSFAQTLPNDGVNLCGQQNAVPPHTRVAFIWAVRIPNTPMPAVQIGKANYIPADQKSPVPVEVPDREWKYLQRARLWTLDTANGEKTKITVLKLGNQKALELDLTRAKLAPGDYKLSGFWDWTPFTAAGGVHVKDLSNFESAKLEPFSQDRLLAKSGKVPVTVADADFEFIDKVELKKLNDEFATAEPIRFLLPVGLREGPQNHMDVQIDTGNLDSGKYQLLLAQQDGKTHPVTISVLPNLPKIDNLPVLANEGTPTQHFVLKGEGLELLAKLTAPGVSFDLGPAAGGGTQRNLTVNIESDLKPGSKVSIEARLSDRSVPLTLSDALQITGPLPAIASSRLSLPTGMTITLPQDEFPAGYNFTAMLDVKNLEPSSALHLGCADGAVSPASLHLGEQSNAGSLQQLSPDQLFLSFDTSAFPAGCQLQALIDNGKAGRSQPFNLARIIRIPEIEFLTPGAAPEPNGDRAYTLTGKNLEMIEKAGWDQLAGVPVSALPSPIPGQGQKQSLSLNLPDPPPQQGFLYVWLRGEKAASATTVSAPAKTPVSSPASALPSSAKPVRQ